MKSERIIFEGIEEIGTEEIDLLEPKENQILVKTLTSIISTGTELTVLSGDFPSNSFWDNFAEFPFVPGYSNVGEVVEKGDSVKKFEIGDRVATYAAHSEYSLVEVSETMEEGDPKEELMIPRGAVKVPDGVTNEEAVFHNLAITAMNSVRLADVSMGENIVIVGAGLIGQFAIMFSRTAGGLPIAIELSESRLEIARKSGAIKTVNGAQDNLKEIIKDETSEEGADKVFEVTGNSKVIPEIIKFVKPLGELIVLSSPRGKTEMDYHDEVNAPSRTIKGTHISSHPDHKTPYNPWTARRNTELFFDYLKNDYIDVEHLVSQKYPRQKAEKAYKNLLKERERFMGVILGFEE